VASFARISITLPREILAAADRQARTLDRSRSWLVAEALRRYLEDSAGPAAKPPRSGGAVREVHPPPYRVVSGGLGDYRLQQLKADLALTPEQRVLGAERTARVAEQARPGSKGQRVLQFDRYEDAADIEVLEEIKRLRGGRAWS